MATQDEIQVSLHGRRLGLDVDGFVVAAPALRVNVTSPGTAASTLAAHGVTRLMSTVAVTHELARPYPGVEKTLISSVTSTLAQIVTCASGTTLDGSATTLTFASTVLNKCVKLVGLSTIQWGIVANTGSVTSS